MKKNYDTPELLLTKIEKKDVIATSGGDTPLMCAFDL